MCELAAKLGKSILSAVALVGILGGVLSAQTTDAPKPAEPTGTKQQTIDFGLIPAQSATSMVALTARASSGLPVSFVSTTTAICTISGSTASLHDDGTCILQANQAGDAVYAPAAIVTESFTAKSAGVCCGPFNVAQGQIVNQPGLAKPPSYILSADCPFPTIASVSPSTWFAGVTYQVVVKGTGFTSRDHATASCPATYVTASSQPGSAMLFNATVINSTTIVGTVSTPETDSEQTANVAIWTYAPPEDDAAPAAQPALKPALKPASKH